MQNNTSKENPTSSKRHLSVVKIIKKLVVDAINLIIDCAMLVVAIAVKLMRFIKHYAYMVSVSVIATCAVFAKYLSGIGFLVLIIAIIVFVLQVLNDKEIK